MCFIGQTSIFDSAVSRAYLARDNEIYLFGSEIGGGVVFKLLELLVGAQTEDEHYKEETKRNL